MLAADQIDSLVTASLQRLGLMLRTKPVIFGGLAMEYYGLRAHGDDIDLLVSPEDLAMLWARYPDQRRDMWGAWACWRTAWNYSAASTGWMPHILRPPRVPCWAHRSTKRNNQFPSIENRRKT